MECVRCAEWSDREAMQALWSTCFHDSERFMDWFFKERFYPSLSSCLVDGGELRSMLHSVPFHIRLRGQILPASMLAGVATHPDHGGKGYMKRIFLHYMQNVRAAGIPIAVHTPANLPTFFSRGHYPTTRTRLVSLSCAQRRPMPPEVTPHSLFSELAPLSARYQLTARQYSGMVDRSLADFAFKFRDYASDGAQCLIVPGDEVAVRGYAVYYPGEKQVHAEEVLAAEEATYQLLLEALSAEAAGKKLTAKLPPDLPFGEFSARQGVMGMADVGALLAALPSDRGIRFAVYDNTVPQNEGRWNGRGEPDDGAPHVSLEAGRLGQLIAGYASLAELAEAGHATIHDPAAAKEIDACYPTLACYIVDEY